MDPALANFLDLKNAGVDMNLFRNDGIRALAAECLTPPEPRFREWPQDGVAGRWQYGGDGDAWDAGDSAAFCRSALSAELQWGWASRTPER